MKCRNILVHNVCVFVFTCVYVCVYVCVYLFLRVCEGGRTSETETNYNRRAILPSILGLVVCRGLYRFRSCRIQHPLDQMLKLTLDKHVTANLPRYWKLKHWRGGAECLLHVIR